MDSRGTWDSNPLNASDAGVAAVSNILQSFPRNQSTFDAVKASSAAFIKDIELWSTPPGIVQYISAREVAHDYEQIRIALGYEKVNFLALSYGTYRANQYAAYYPQRVGNFVFDAVIPHGIAYKKVLESAPIPALNCVAEGGSPGCATTVTALNIQLAVSNDLESQGVDFPTLFQSLNTSLHGDASAFGGSGAVPSNLNIFTIGTILLECGDNNYQDTTFAEWEKSLNAGLTVLAPSPTRSPMVASDAQQHDPNQIAQPPTWQLQLGCLAWPFPTPPYAPLITEVPMLLVTSDFDGGAPTEWAEASRAQAHNSVLVVRHGDSHTSFSLSDQPSTIIMKEFLVTGRMPTAMNNSQVTVYTPGMIRAPIPDPYSVLTGEVAGDVNSGNLTNAAILP
ncbi:hypothetical protein MMC18_008595 [Xylographa bjoerkii]|nr:hypothetical protein [Xylographa bjoerkii]